MTRILAVGLAVLALSTSAALATHRHHHYARNTYSGVAPPPPATAMWMGGANGDDHKMYLKNLHDSGYEPRNDYDANGVMKVQ